MIFAPLIILAKYKKIRYQVLKKNIWTLATMALVLVLAMAGDASAQSTSGSTIMQTAQQKATSVFSSVKTIIFIIGGFGLVGLAWAAIFGKVNWKWFASLAVGLAILAAASSVVEYATGSTEATTAGLTTTFGNI